MTEASDPDTASNGDDELETMASAGDDVEYMFAQTSAGVTVNLDGRITLVGVSATTLFFSDRPYRVTGHISTEEFVAQWGQGRQFRRGPPRTRCSRCSN